MIQKIRMDMSIGSNIQKRRYQCKLKQDQVIAKMNLMGIPISKSSYAKIDNRRDYGNHSAPASISSDRYD